LQTDWMDDKQHKKVLTILGEKTWDLDLVA
jgi:hypothetical protein